MVKRQHYVSQFYLKNFVTTTGKLYVYDRIKGNTFLSSVENICLKSYLYETPWEDTKKDIRKYVNPNDSENIFSKMETQFERVSSSVCKKCEHMANNVAICDKKEIDTLIRMIVNFYVRTPYSLEQIKKDVWWKETNLYLDICGLFDKMEWGGGHSVFEAAILKGTITDENENSPVFKMIQELKCLNFDFLYSPKGGFVTGSFPSLIGHDIDNNNRLFAALTLSPKICLTFSNTIDRKDRNKRFTISDGAAFEFNKLYLTKDPEQIQYIICDNKTDIENIKKLDMEMKKHEQMAGCKTPN